MSPSGDSGWTGATWNAIKGASSYTWTATAGVCTWTASAAWSLASKTAAWFRDADLIEEAGKGKVQASVADAGRMLGAAVQGDVAGGLAAGAQLAKRWYDPKDGDNRLVAGSVTGAIVGAKFCGPKCALVGGMAGCMYGHFKKPKDN